VWWPIVLFVPVLPAALCVVAGAGAVLFATLAPGDADPPAVAEAAAAPSQPPGATHADEPDAPAAAGDPWADPDLPSVLWEARARVETGEDVDESMHAELMRATRSDPDDARPHLLLGHVYAARLWRSDALSRYESAVRIDRDARHDPRMLENLLALVAHRRVGARAAQDVETIYGVEAVPAIDRALALDETTSAEATRLRALRRRVAPQNEARE
jgi:hypothetical protein